MADTATIIAANLKTVRQRIDAAAARSGRPGTAVTLVAVTKYVDSRTAGMLADAGCLELGESRPQELWRKAAELEGRAVHWHLVGHLQRNKVRRTLPQLALFHAGDSLRLLEELDRVAGELQRRPPVLLEVNVSGDATKHGFAAAELPPLLPQLAPLVNLQFRGLMAMAGLEGDLADARREFQALRLLRDRLQREAPPNVALEELSMGMSGDFEVAIEEGATIVRIGSALFESLAL